MTLGVIITPSRSANEHQQYTSRNGGAVVCCMSGICGVFTCAAVPALTSHLFVAPEDRNQSDRHCGSAPPSSCQSWGYGRQCPYGLSRGQHVCTPPISFSFVHHITLVGPASHYWFVVPSYWKVCYCRCWHVSGVVAVCTCSTFWAEHEVHHSMMQRHSNELMPMPLDNTWLALS
jgi:hypothetical protein